MRKIFLIALLFNSLIVMGQNSLNLVPMPAEVNVQPQVKSKFIFSASTKLFYNDKALQKDIDYLVFACKQNFGISLIPVLQKVDFKKIHQPVKNAVTVTLLSADYKNGDNDDFYNITSSTSQLAVTVNSPRAFFYSIQTLLQIIESNNGKRETNNKKRETDISLPQLTISDYPRFQYRGMHLDVCRHFEPVSFVKKYIDYLAAYKFNTFHWHLTDDQGWRIEIKKYPNLTKTGAWRNGTIIGRYPGKGNDGLRHGGYYTQEEIKEVVKYAADRYITIIPEIEMPGHASAAIAAYPQLSCFPDEDTQVPKDCAWNGPTKGKQVQQTWGVFEDVFAPTDYTFNFLQDVLDEVTALFPSKYIHIGGDECPKEAWKRSAFCQQLIKEKGLKDEHGLQSYFIQRIEKYLNSKGRNIIGWDEILEGGLAPNATVMSWRGEEGGIEAAKQNHDVIMTPGGWCYLDHSQSKNEDSVTIGGYTPLEKVYSYEPVPAVLNAEQAKHVLGAQGNVWAEYMKNPSKIEYMIFPRMLALSEVLWTPKEKRNWADFEKRLPYLFANLDKRKINYSKAYYDLKATVLPAEDNEGVLWKIEQKQNGTVVLNKTSPLLSENNIAAQWNYTKPELINKSCVFSATNYKTLLIQKFSFNKATGKKITLINQPHKNYPGDGAFTLVNGVQNEKGLARSSEFLGFLGTDLDATIDLKTATDISKITLHVLDQNGSWIYLPKQVEVTYIPDIDYTEEELKKAPKEIKTIDPLKDKGSTKIIIESKQNCRYVHIVAKNFGTIPSGNPGAGNAAWLFVDEIEIE